MLTRNWKSLVLAGIWLAAFHGGAALAPAATEAELLAVLQSGAALKEKADACRQLSVVATAKSVAPLAALLANEELSHMVRYALEPIPDPAVDRALRDALGRLKGRPLAGAIISLGVRRDAQAAPLLAPLLQSEDSDVAQAAARAMGSIGTDEAAQALEAARAAAAPALQLALIEGLLRSAEAMAADGRRPAALAIYRRLQKPALAQQVRAAAVRGALLASAQNRPKIMQQNLAHQDYVRFAAAVKTSYELPGPRITEALAASLGSLPEDRQILVIQALARRRDTVAAAAALTPLAKEAPKPVRIAALRGLVELGQPAVPEPIQLALRDPDREIAQTALDGLASLPGAEVDAAVMRMLDSDDPASQLMGLDLIGRRRMTSALPVLLDLARRGDPKLRPAALKRLGELGGDAETPALLDMVMRAPAPAEMDAAEQALTAVAARSAQPEASAAPILRQLPQADPASKSALLRVLSTLGGPSALQAVRAAVNDPDAGIRSNAIRALGQWRTPDAAPALLALAKNAASPADKLLCLRGYLGWAANTDLQATQRLDMCRQAMPIIQTEAEKKLLLGTLGGIVAVPAVQLIAPYLDDPAVREEAVTATVTVAERLLTGRNATPSARELVPALQQAASKTGNAELAQKIRQLINRAQKPRGS